MLACRRHSQVTEGGRDVAGWREQCKMEETVQDGGCKTGGVLTHHGRQDAFSTRNWSISSPESTSKPQQAPRSHCPMAPSPTPVRSLSPVPCNFSHARDHCGSQYVPQVPCPLRLHTRSQGLIHHLILQAWPGWPWQGRVLRPRWTRHQATGPSRGNGDLLGTPQLYCLGRTLAREWTVSSGWACHRLVDREQILSGATL